MILANTFEKVENDCSLVSGVYLGIMKFEIRSYNYLIGPSEKNINLGISFIYLFIYFYPWRFLNWANRLELSHWLCWMEIISVIEQKKVSQ